MNEVKKYCEELFIKFENETSEKINLTNKASFDLIKAVYSFRAYPNENEFIEKFPELEEQRRDITKLWSIFKEKTNEELADWVIESIHEVY